MIVLIPAYEPDERLTGLIATLRRDAPDAGVVVVDDGSGPAYAPTFRDCEELGATVLTLLDNSGKGHALKLGLRHVTSVHPGRDVVAADCDGQHTGADILKVAAATAGTDGLVLGVRRFVGDVPARSRLGNAASSLLFRLATGVALTDTQTGLRGYPAGLIGWAAGVGGERFDYEQRVLLAATRDGVPLVEVGIATVYLEGNRSSHFRPLVDSVRVLAPVLRFLASSLLGFVVDTVALLALTAAGFGLLPAVLAARGLSASTNFLVNRFLVFEHGRAASLRSSAARYGVLAGVLLAAGYGLLVALTGLGVPLLVAKLGTESTLALASFHLQRTMVFPAPVAEMRQAAPEPARRD